MRFDSIEIKNYRQYKEVSFEFPKQKDTDLHIIIADNGIGKTNLLNAINWCLYGDEPHLGGSDLKTESLKNTLPICNLSATKEAERNAVDSVPVSVKICATEGDIQFQFIRELDFKIKTKFPGRDVLKVAITTTDGTKFYTEEEAKRLIDLYIPQKIRQYFFFDGEQLDSYFQKQDTNHIKDSIYQIAQINIVMNVASNLKNVANEYRKEAQPNPELDKYQQEYSARSQSLKNAEKDRMELQKSNHLADARLSEIAAMNIGTDTYIEDKKHYENNLTSIDNCNKRMEVQENKLVALVRTYTIVLSMYDVNKRTFEFIQDKYESGALPPSIDKELIRQSLSQKKCALCGAGLSDDGCKHLNELVRQFEVSSKVSNILSSIKSDVIREYNIAKDYKRRKESIYEEMKNIEQERDRFIKNNEDIYKRISSVSDGEGIKARIDEANRLRECRDINNQKIGSLTERCNNLKNEITELENKIKKLQIDANKSDEARRYLTFIYDAIRIVTAIHEEIIESLRQRMEAETMTIFNSLMWKKNTYDHIQLEEDYKLQLFHKNENISCLGTCSAAERELLALAFTIALHNVSHHQNLLFIDTPVSRVSGENRANFAKALLDVCKKRQLILTLTPDEFSSEIEPYFNNTTWSTYRYLNTSNEQYTVEE